MRNPEYNKKYYKKNPWMRTYSNIISRCVDPSVKKPNIHNYHRYGGRGIRCLITKDELKYLWVRDKAHLMKTPSIDRIDSDGHYEIGNCRYIERDVNSSLQTRKKIAQLSIDGKLIKVFESVADANESFGKNRYHSGDISHVATGKSLTAFGFKWKYINQ